MKKSKHAFRFVAADEGPVEVLLYEQIGQTFWGDGMTARAFREELAKHEGREILLRVNSAGGSVYDGIAMYHALVEHDGEVTAVVDGIAASMASLILMAAEHITVKQGAQVMVHMPWTIALGDAEELRQEAAILEQLGDGMAEIYAARTGRKLDDVKGLMAAETWMSADSAVEEKFADEVGLPYAPGEDDEEEERQKAALTKWDVRMFARAPAGVYGTKRLEFKRMAPKKALALLRGLQLASASTTDEEFAMTEEEKQKAAKAAEEAKKQAAAAAAAAPQLPEGTVSIEAETKRKAEIRAVFKPFGETHAELLGKCVEDMQCSAERARGKLLEALGVAAQPIAVGSAVNAGEDASDKRMTAMVQATLQRTGMTKDPDTKQSITFDGANPYRGLSLREVARACLRNAGRNPDGMSALEVARAVLVRRVGAGGQSTSDFPVFLENTLHKLVLEGFKAITPACQAFCKIGSVTDFREWRRIVPGMIANLEVVNEAGEYKNKPLPDGEKESIAAQRRGNIIEVTPETLVNDDLGAIADIARGLGMAGPRTIDRAVFALLALNANLGPVLVKTGQTLIHANHGNTNTGAPAVAVLASMAEKMQLQKFPGTDQELMDISPSVAVARPVVGGEIDVVVNSQYDPDSNNKLQRANKVRGLVSTIVKTARMPATIFYVFADPNLAPVIEVVFLDGQQQVRVVQEENFRTAGLAWRGELNAGVGAIDFRGVQFSTGA